MTEEAKISGIKSANPVTELTRREYFAEILTKEADKIQEYLEITSSTNPEELQERLVTLMPYLARSGEMLAQAKRLLRKKKSAEISKTIIAIAKESHLSASVQNALLEIAEDEHYLVDKLERLNRSCVHHIDALRSLLSYEREGLRLNNTGY
jgi:CHASE3 domain sensor protein